MANRSPFLYRLDRLTLAIASSLALGGVSLLFSAVACAHDHDIGQDMSSPASGAIVAVTSSSRTDSILQPIAQSFAMSAIDLPLSGNGNAAVAGGSQPESDLYLEVWRGDRSTQKLAHFKLRNGLLWATPSDLAELGVVVDSSIAVDSDGMLQLDSLPGLAYHYDVANQRVVLDVPIGMRPRQILGYTPPAAVHAERGSGMSLTYDSYANSQKGHTNLSVATVLRWFGRAGTLEQSGLSRTGGNATSYQRLDTRWTYSDPDHLWTWTGGDLISGGLSWTRPVRMGGLQWRRNFGVRPDLITYPVPTFASQATVPSSVQLLVNNIQQFGAQVEDGPFVLDTFPRISGAGEATLIVRDALGRVTQTTVSIYSDTQRLAKGMTDFSVEAGMLRHDYGSAQDGYGHQPVFSGSLRRGLSDDFTLEAHAESGPHLGLAGLGMVWSPFGHWGLLSASAAGSQGNGHGWQRSIGYQWNSPHFGVDLQAQRASSGFRDLGSVINGLGQMKEQDRASFWVPIHHGSLAYSWVHWRDASDKSSRVQTLSWSQNLGKLVYLTASAFHDQSTGTGLGLSLTMPLGRDMSASLNVSHANGHTDAMASVRHNLPYEGGWGWEVQAGEQRYMAAGSAIASFRGNYGDALLGVNRNGGQTGAFASVNGSLAWMDGRMFASRRIGDSFAVVSTDGVPNVPILYENRVFGMTGSTGYLLIPDLRGWQRNRLAIDPDRLGANYRLSALEQFATPANADGILVHFGVEKLQPMVAVLLGPDGKPVPAGTPGKIIGKDLDVLTGFDGEAYVENVPAGTVIQMDVGEVSCRYHLPLVAASSAQARVGPLACERSEK